MRVRTSRTDVEPFAVANAFDLRTFWLTLWWRARLIAGITLAAVALTAAALIVIPPNYQATAVVIVDPRQLHVTDTPTVLTGIGADVAAVESQVEIITSTALAHKVITAAKLENDPEFAQSSLLDEISYGLHALVGGDPDALQRTKEGRLISNLQKNLTVRRRGQTYVLEINFYAKDAAKAARIANAFAQAYLIIADQREILSSTNATASEWLDARMEEMRGRVRQSDEAVENYRSSHNFVDVTQGNKLINRQIEDLTQQIAMARTYTADARARMDQVEYAARHNDDPATLNEVLHSPVIANLRSQYSDAARAVSEYSTMYGERYPALSVVRARLADVRRQINDEIARTLTGVRSDYQTAVSRENTLEGELSKLKEQSATTDQAEIKLHELEQKRRRSEAPVRAIPQPRQANLRTAKPANCRRAHRCPGVTATEAEPSRHVAAPRCSALRRIACCNRDHALDGANASRLSQFARGGAISLIAGARHAADARRIHRRAASSASARRHQPECLQICARSSPLSLRFAVARDTGPPVR